MNRVKIFIPAIFLFLLIAFSVSYAVTDRPILFYISGIFVGLYASTIIGKYYIKDLPVIIKKKEIDYERNNG